MILSLLHAFCFRGTTPIVANQNIILLKLVLAPESEVLDHVRVQPKSAQDAAKSHAQVVISHAISRTLESSPSRQLVESAAFPPSPSWMLCSATSCSSRNSSCAADSSCSAW